MEKTITYAHKLLDYRNGIKRRKGIREEEVILVDRGYTLKRQISNRRKYRIGT